MVSCTPNMEPQKAHGKLNAGKEYYLEGEKKESSVSVCLRLSSSLYTHQTKSTSGERCVTGMRKRSFSLPDSLSLQPPLSRDAGALVWYPIVTAMNFPLLSGDYAAVTKLDEWHAWQWM